MTGALLPLFRADEIIITPDLANRPDRPADLRREAAAFHDISAAIVADPVAAVQLFLDVAMDLCSADAAGLSLPVEDGGQPQFEWDALAGVYAEFVGGRVPRDDSPCGLARKRGHPIVVSLPGRVFPEFAAVDPAIREGLIVPFYDNGGVFIGTIWVVHTQASKQFCANDVRIMEQLAVQLVLALKLVREQHDLRNIRAMLDDPDIVLDPTAAQTGSAWPHLAGWTDGREVRAEVAEFVEASAFRNSVLASSGDCMKVLDLDARVQFMNQGGIVLMEVSDPDSIIGVDWLKVWSGDEAALAQEAFHSARAGEAARFRGEAPTFAGTPRYWDVHLTPIRDQQGKIRHVLATSRDMTDHRRIEQQRELLAGELDHRVKNILAVVAAIAHQTFRPPVPMDKATEVFIRRISALGEAQSILTNSSWNSADISVVVHGALEPLRSDANRFLIDGRPFELSSSRALALALAIHELGTNATKYGALSQIGGMVSIQWNTSKTADGEFLTFRWSESGGPRVMVPESRGFGSKLIERALAAEFRGTVPDRLRGGGRCVHSDRAD